MSSRVAITNSSGLTQLEKRNYEDGSGLNAHRHQQQRNATVQWRVFQVFFFFEDENIKPYFLLAWAKLNMSMNYNFDMLAMIWHEIVCWFMVISPFLPVLVCCDHKIVLHWYENQNKKQFSDHVVQIIVNPGKSSEIN